MKSFKAWWKSIDWTTAVCNVIGHTAPYQKMTGPADEVNRSNVRQFCCRRCGLVFGRVAPGR